MNNLLEHARHELELCGQSAKDPEFAQSLERAVEAFASYGHSGGSAMAGIDMLTTLLNFGNLSPLTDDPAEWIDQSDASGCPMWQSNRNYEAFSDDDGKTYWLLSEGGSAENRAPRHDSLQRGI